MSDLSTAARPYAKAAFEFAQEQGAIADWSKRLQFLAAVADHPDMRIRLERPDISQADRAEMMLKVAGDELGAEGANFVRLLAENNRLGLLTDIAAGFEIQRRDADGEIEAHVTSAYELTDEQRQKIIDALGRRLSRKVRIVNTVDPDLIGGAIIRAGDLVIDGSLKGRVEKMSGSLSQ